MMTDEKLINKIISSVWVEWGTRRLTTRVAEHWTSCTAHYDKFFKHPFPDQCCLMNKGKTNNFFNKHQLDDLIDFTHRDLLAQGFEEFYEKKALKIFKTFLNICHKIHKQNLTQLSNHDLSKLLKKFTTTENYLTCHLYPIFIFDYFLPDLFENELSDFLKENGNPDDFESWKQIIITPFKMAAHFDQEVDLLKSTLAIFKKQSTLQKESLKLQKKYGYFGILNMDEEPLPIKYFREKITELTARGAEALHKELAQKVAFPQENEKKYTELVKKIKDKKLITIINAVHKTTYYRDYRNEVRRNGYFLAKDLYEELARRFSLTLSQVLHLRKAEIFEVLQNGKFEKKTLPDTYLIAKIGKEVYFIEENIDFFEKYFNPKTPIKELKGLGVSPGKIQATVKVILDAHTGKGKFKSGDIIVTSMTNIDFVPLMGRASAIITDEGGMLCHAAIVSREMGKSCIVGTKIATKVFKDGDLVEVDADRGVVRKIDE